MCVCVCTRTFSKNNKGKNSYTWLASYLCKFQGFQGSLVSKDPSSLLAWPRPFLPTLTSYPQIRAPASTLPCREPRTPDLKIPFPRGQATCPVPSSRPPRYSPSTSQTPSLPLAFLPLPGPVHAGAAGTVEEGLFPGD